MNAFFLIGSSISSVSKSSKRRSALLFVVDLFNVRSGVFYSEQPYWSIDYFSSAVSTGELLTCSSSAVSKGSNETSCSFNWLPPTDSYNINQPLSHRQTHSHPPVILGCRRATFSRRRPFPSQYSINFDSKISRCTSWIDPFHMIDFSTKFRNELSSRSSFSFCLELLLIFCTRMFGYVEQWA